MSRDERTDRSFLPPPLGSETSPHLFCLLSTIGVAKGMQVHSPSLE